MLMSITNRHNQQGIGLLELMLSLAIISVLLVMATRYYKSADQGQKISNSISLINGIAGAGAQYLNANPDKTFQDLTPLIADHYLPDNFKTIKSPWGTDIFATGTGGQVTVTFKAVPGAPCRILKSSLSGTEGTTCGGGDAVADLVVKY